MSVFLEKEWFKTINDNLKVPVYGMMGSSYSFILIYVLVDIMEVLKECCNYLYVQLNYCYKRVIKHLYGKKASLTPD